MSQHTHVAVIGVSAIVLGLAALMGIGLGSAHLLGASVISLSRDCPQYSLTDPPAGCEHEFVTRNGCSEPTGRLRCGEPSSECFYYEEHCPPGGQACTGGLSPISVACTDPRCSSGPCIKAVPLLAPTQQQIPPQPAAPAVPSKLPVAQRSAEPGGCDSHVTCVGPDGNTYEVCGSLDGPNPCGGANSTALSPVAESASADSLSWFGRLRNTIALFWERLF